MLHQSAHVTAMIPSFAMMDSITTRFGTIIVDTDRALVFPRGLLGMPDKHRFVLANFPGVKMQQFTMLQSLDDEKLSFITLSLGMQNPIIHSQDIRNACRDMQITQENLAILLIVSVHRGFEQTKLSVNARAPLLIDTNRKTAVQHVLQNDKYKVQHML